GDTAGATQLAGAVSLATRLRSQNLVTRTGFLADCTETKLGALILIRSVQGSRPRPRRVGDRRLPQSAERDGRLLPRTGREQVTAQEGDLVRDNRLVLRAVVDVE